MLWCLTLRVHDLQHLDTRQQDNIHNPGRHADSMKSSEFTIWTALCTLLALTGTTQAGTPLAQAFIHSGEDGQAILMTRLNECYAVTPAHVMGDDMFATLIGGRSQAPRGEGDLLQAFGYDLAILRVTGDISRNCGTSIGKTSDLDARLSSISQASVSSVNPDGSLTRRNVTLVDVGLTHIRIRPNTVDDQLFKGLSGSLLLIDDQPAGLLMTVDPDSGEGRALRFDRTLETLRPFFGLSATTSTASSTSKNTEHPNRTIMPGILSATVTTWSTDAIDAEHRAVNLTDTEGSKTQWYAKPGPFPIEIVLDLDGDKAQVVQEIVLVGDGVMPRERLPRDFELFISSTTQGRWIPVHTGTYFQQDARKSIKFAPLRARRVMLRIYSHWGDEGAVGLSQIEFPTAP